MRLTRRTDYAMHLVADLASAPGQSLGLRALAERHGVTYPFARTVQQGLLKAGIIKTARGIKGGMVLSKPLNQITVLEIFEAAQGSIESIFATDNKSWCQCEGECGTSHIWSKTANTVREYFAGITMQQALNHDAPKL